MVQAECPTHATRSEHYQRANNYGWRQNGRRTPKAISLDAVFCNGGRSADIGGYELVVASEFPAVAAGRLGGVQGLVGGLEGRA